MNHPFRQHALAICTAGACLFSAAAFAANGNGPVNANTQTQQYKQDIARCNAGQTPQDPANCKKEAGAALEDARRNRLEPGNPTMLEQNATARCQALPADQRQDCMVQMSDQNTTVTGSVAGGGILRETTITVPAESDASMPSSTPQTTPMPMPQSTPAPMPQTRPMR